MKIKSWPLLLICGVLFTIATIYWYVTHPEDTSGIVIFAVAGILFIVAGLGNWKSNR